MVYDSVHVFARGLEAATREGPELRIRYDNFEFEKKPSELCESI